jgi:purine catabolism regulator
VVHAPTRPPERLVAVAERAAAALALHRLHDRQRDSVVRRTHHELMLGLLTDPAAPELIRRCVLAGLPTAKRQLVGLTLRPRFDIAGDTGEPATVVEEAIAATVHAAHELRTPALVCEIERDIRVVLSLAPTAHAEHVVDDLAARVQRRHAVVAGMGRPVTRPTEIDRTLREAQHVVQSLRGSSGATGVHRLEDVHLRGLLAMLVDDDRLLLYVDRELDVLRAQDPEGGLLEVVRALVLHPTSKSDAAASLHMSRPVFYDRLAKVGRLLGVDLDDPDIRVSLHVALVADEVTREAS